MSETRYGALWSWNSSEGWWPPVQQRKWRFWFYAKSNWEYGSMDDRGTDSEILVVPETFFYQEKFMLNPVAIPVSNRNYNQDDV